jgi:superfamily I DNA/RNA helicase
MSLNFNQRLIVEYPSHCKVIACPGSGKTRVLAHKAEYILDNDPEARIVIATFTRESAKDIRKRITDVVGEQHASRVACGNFHALARDQLNRSGFRLNIVNKAQSKQYVRRALEKCRFENIEFKTAQAFVESKRYMPDFVPTGDDLGAVYTAYENMLQYDNVIDFSGIINLAVKWMRCGKLKPKPCEYIFIDEAQDMDCMQFAWCAEHMKAGAKCTVVGDDDQSIYRFRGAEGLSGMMRFETEFGAKTFKMVTNYRCRQEILGSAKNVIDNNTKRFSKVLEAARGPGGCVEILPCADEIQEANMVVARILSLCKDNENLYPDQYSVGINNGEWAVLARNGHNLNTLAVALSENKIPYSYKEKDEWSEEPVCFALQLLASLESGEMTGLNAALHYVGISQEALGYCEEWYDGFLETFLHYSHENHLTSLGEELSSKILNFMSTARLWESDLKKSRVNHVIESVFSWFIENLNLMSSRDGKNYIKEIKALNKASKYLIAMDGTLKRRLQLKMIGINSNHRNGNKNTGVYLGTLHSSKGLEFKYVWILKANIDVMPSTNNITRESIEEERRLFYVGMTRAQDALFISFFGQPSIFIMETGLPIIKASDD